MNCDEAFEAITDPARSDDELLWHLDLCPRCRQMQEILQPALHMLAPVEGDDRPTGDSPGWGQPSSFSPDAVDLAERAAARLSQRRSMSTPSRAGFWFRNLAVALAGAALASCLLLAIDRSHQSSPDGGATAVSVCTRSQVNSQEHKSPAAEPQRPAAIVLTCARCHIPERVRFE